MSQFDSVFSLTCYQAGFPLISGETTLYDIASKVAKAIERIASNIFQLIDSILFRSPDKTALPKSELQTYNTTHNESYTNHFRSSNCDGHPFPYDIPGIPREKEYNKAIYHHFVGQIISFSEDKDPIELLNACLNGDHGTKVQRRALHASAIMKLLGDKNTPVSIEMNTALEGQFYDPIPYQYGKLTIVSSNIGDGEFKFQVTSETIDLKNMFMETIGQYTTSRAITVFPPDENGNVSYTVQRSFQPMVNTDRRN